MVQNATDGNLVFGAKFYRWIERENMARYFSRKWEEHKDDYRFNEASLHYRLVKRFVIEHPELARFIPAK